MRSGGNSSFFSLKGKIHKHLSPTVGFRHIGIVHNHTNGIVGVVGKNAVEHVLVAIKDRVKDAAAIIRGILDGKERKENHHLNDLTVGKLAVRFLFESLLTFSNVYGHKYVHYPLYARSAATFCEIIMQLRNDLSIFVHTRSIPILAFHINIYMRNLYNITQRFPFCNQSAIHQVCYEHICKRMVVLKNLVLKLSQTIVNLYP